MPARFTILLFLVQCAAIRAWAEDPARSPEAPIEIVVRAERKIAAAHAKDPTAAGTSLDLTDRVTLPRSLGDVVRESAGAQVVSTGGIGAFASLSLRGAASDETLVLLGELPLSTADGGAFDLSLFPAELFAKVNTFRGGAPVWLGSGAIGGVLQLVPHTGKRNRTSASVGAGSFGTYQLASSDDQTFKLKNADFTETSGVQDLSVPLWGGTLHMVSIGVVRGGGLSGRAAQPTPKVRRASARADSAGLHARRRPGWLRAPTQAPMTSRKVWVGALLRVALVCGCDDPPEAGALPGFGNLDAGAGSDSATAPAAPTCSPCSTWRPARRASSWPRRPAPAGLAAPRSISTARSCSCPTRAWTATRSPPRASDAFSNTPTARSPSSR